MEPVTRSQLVGVLHHTLQRLDAVDAAWEGGSAAFGSAGVGSAALELRFMAGNADVQVGDLLSTSGVDGVYPPGVPVAKVVSVDRKVDTGFARIVLTPAALPDSVRHVLVLEPIGLQMPPKPEPIAEESNVKPAKKGSRK